MKNEEYFTKQCEVLEYLLLRSDSEHSAIKTVIRCAAREACNFATELPGYDNKLGAKIISKKAFEQLSKGNKSELIGEHVVPISIVLTKLNNIKDISVTSISDLVKMYSTKAVITKEEDERLKDNKLQKNMPDDWCGKDIMSRYKYVNIEVKDMTYKEALKMYNKVLKCDR